MQRDKRCGGAGLALLLLMALSATAEDAQLTGWRPHSRRRCCPPPATVAPEQIPEAIPETPDEPGEEVPEIDLESALAGPVSPATGPRGAPHMIGDILASMFALSGSPEVIGTTFYAVGGNPGEYDVLAPTSVRSFKIAENQSTLPIDRVYADFGNFNDLGGNPDLDLQRYILGFEKTFLDGNASFGLRLPFNVVQPGVFEDSVFGNIGNFGVGTGQQADLGDLSAIFKFLLSQDPASGNAWSAGAGVTAPTGPNTVADVDEVFIPEFNHDGSVQPFISHLRFFGYGWFVHYFIAADIPFDDNDATLLFNDVGIGNIIVLPGPCLTAVVPTFEIHANNPVDDRVIAVNDIVSRDQITRGGQAFFVPGEFIVADQVNATAGCTFEFYQQSTLALGVITPLGDERIYDWEFQLQFNLFANNPLGGLGPAY